MIDKQLYLQNKFYDLFAFIAFHNVHWEDVEEMLLDAVYEVKQEEFTNKQIEDALDYANYRVINESATDILDNTGKYIVDRLIREYATFDEYGNLLPFDVEDN